MSKSVEKIEDQETSSDGGALGIPGRHTQNAGLVSFKAIKRGLKLDSEQEHWPEDDLNGLAL